MIVNSAYMYMRKAPSVPDFPFWENGELKVSTEGSKHFAFFPKTNRAQVDSGTAYFTVDASNYSKIKFNAYGQNISISVYAFENGTEYGTTHYDIISESKDYEFSIPKLFRKPGAKFGFRSLAGKLVLNSIVLTN